MANFRVGQRVVCVDDTGILRGFAPTPVKGSTYTVSGFTDYGIELHECPKPNGYAFNSFKTYRFRPFISQADDVEMFRRISEDSLGRLEVLEDALNEQYLCDETHE